MLATPELLEEAAQSDRLATVLPRYLAQAPLYRGAAEILAAESPAATRASLSRLPFITKRDIRLNFPANFLGAEAELETLSESESIEVEHTSGTSEERTTLLLPRGWWAEQERHALDLNPMVADLLAKHPDARRATINSPVCSGDVCYTGVPSRNERTVGNTLFLSLSRFPFLWSGPELKRMAEEALAWQPRFLDLDPVYGVAFARYLEREGIRLPSLAFILCSYEFVSVTHRRVLERVFKVPVFDLYGSTETGHLLMQDHLGQMRPSLGTAVLEVLHTDEQGIGDLVVTTLTNDVMPLIRYRIGDLVEVAEQPFGTRYLVHGRAADAFLVPGGTRVTLRQIDQCFAGLEGVAHYQLVERPGRSFTLRFIPDAAGPSQGDLAELQQQLSRLLQAGKFSIESTDLLMPENSGKFRLCYPLVNQRSLPS